MKKLRVWDLPLRLFHWSLVAFLLASFVTQAIGGNAMDWHFRAGYAVLTLLAFRLVWGIVGPRYARFSSFLYGPSAIAAYLRGASGPHVGHNPLGSLSVFAMLAVVLAQALSGMFANDDIASEGPLARFVSKDMSDRLTWFHADVNAWILLALVCLHVLAVAWYGLARSQNLVKPMWSGDLELGPDAGPVEATSDSWRTRLLALAILAGCAGGMYYLVNMPRTYL
jgi:cytochrome b